MPGSAALQADAAQGADYRGKPSGPRRAQEFIHLPGKGVGSIRGHMSELFRFRFRTKAVVLLFRISNEVWNTDMCQ